MEIRSMTEEEKGLLAKAAIHIESIAELLNGYKPNRAGSNAYTKLEEALFWLNSMIANHSLDRIPPEAKKEDAPVIIQ